MATHTTRPTNGVSYAYKHTVTSTDVSDGSVIIDFQNDVELIGTFQVTNANGLILNTQYGKLAYPADGQVQITPQATAGTAKIVSLTAVADVSDSLDGTYFILYDEVGSVGFWIDVDDSGTTVPAGASGADRAVEITTVTTDMTAIQVAGVLATAINADSKFSAPATTTAVVTITSSTVGLKADPEAGDSGFTLAVVTEGIPAAVEGSFVLESGQIISLLANRDSSIYTYN